MKRALRLKGRLGVFSLFPLILCGTACGGGGSATPRLDAGSPIRDASHDVTRERLDSAVDASHDAHQHDSHASDAASSRTITFGPGLSATLTPEGQLTVTRNGEVVEATAEQGQEYLDAA